MARKNKQFQFSNEAQNPGSLHGNDFLISELKRQGKLDDYIYFAQHFPNGQLGEKFASWLTSLQIPEVEELVTGLASLNRPEELTPDLYQNNFSIWSRMFNIATRGAGKGEILIIWLIRGATMNGGSNSYDINLNGNKYEVKDWSIQGNTSILAGVKSKVTNFEFWNEIVDTIRRLEKLTQLVNGKPKFKLDQFTPQIQECITKILDRRGSILSGECNQKDLKNFKEFYQLMGQIQHPSRGYTNIILRGPNCEPVELSIEEIPASIRKNLNIEVTETNHYTYILTELRRLKYVRKPDEFQNDMQMAVDQIVAGITYIIFRKDRINITDQFQPVAITMSSLKFIEKDL